MIVNPHDGQAITSKRYTLEPLLNRFIVRRIRQDEDEKVGMIHMPAARKEQQYMAVVVAVGPGGLKDTGERIPLTVKVGDTVMLAQFVPELTISGVSGHMVLTEDMITGIVREVLDVPEYEAPEGEISFQEAYERRQSLVKPS